MADASDEQELRRELSALREELDAITRETQRARASLQDPNDVPVDATTGGKLRTPFLVLPVMFLGPAIFAVVFFSAGGSSGSSETLYGKVTQVSGEAPVPVSARCTVFIHPVNDEDSHWDTRITVLCDHHVVYGTDEHGYIDCHRGDPPLRRCVDASFSHDGGDPKLEFDRARRRVRIEDRGPDWSVDVELTTPPAGEGGTDGRR